MAVADNNQVVDNVVDNNENAKLNNLVKFTVSSDENGYSVGTTEEGDTAYLIGFDGKDGEGRIAAIVYGFNDNRYVLVPNDRIIYEPEIEHILGLKKKNPTVDYACSHEKSCGAIIFREVDGVRQYLVIENRSFHPGFPKGHVEYGETELQTVAREIEEETGLKVELIDGFRCEYSYMVRTYITKTAVYYLARYANQEVVPQEGEVLDYWHLPYDEAMEKMDFEDDKKLLKAAEDFLNK